MVDPNIPDEGRAAAPSASQHGAGRVIAGKYRLLDLLGRGGPGEVHRAIQLDLDRTVALKLLCDLEASERDRFVAEARITAGLRHPGVAEVFDAGIDSDGTPYYAMELLLGETLAERLERDGTIPAEEVVPIAAAVCSALEAAHARGVLHRDVKPSNIFLARRADGGIGPEAHRLRDRKELAPLPEEVRTITLRGLGKRPQNRTLPHIILGTPLYMSPEQALGDPLDARTDLYSLAATLYEALAGTPPFDAPSVPRLLQRILRDEPEPIAVRAPDAGVPAPLDREILRALAKAPADRHENAAELATALWRALSEPREAAPAATAPGSSRARLRALGVASLAVLALAFVLANRPRPTGPSAPAVAAAPSAPVSTGPSVELGPPAPLPLPDEPSAVAPRAAPSARRRAAVAPAPTAAAAPAAATSAPSPPDYRIDDLKSPF